MGRSKETTDNLKYTMNHSRCKWISYLNQSKNNLKKSKWREKFMNCAFIERIFLDEFYLLNISKVSKSIKINVILLQFRCYQFDDKCSIPNNLQNNITVPFH